MASNNEEGSSPSNLRPKRSSQTSQVKFDLGFCQTIDNANDSLDEFPTFLKCSDHSDDPTPSPRASVVDDGNPLQSAASAFSIDQKSTKKRYAR